MSCLNDYHELDQIINLGDKEMAKDEGEKLVPVFVQIMKKPARKILVKRGIKATHYLDYCKEVGCDVWDVLSTYSNALTEPMGMWLPEAMIPEGTSKYVQGVEFAAEANIKVPSGFELVDMDEVDMILFQGPPFDDED